MAYKDSLFHVVKDKVILIIVILLSAFHILNFAVTYILSSFENSTVYKDCKVFVQKLQISCKQSPRNSIMLENV
ncbi:MULTISPECIES: hypothetical protein [Bacillus cereus group]|uniref:Uncharacterized protein n=1 Tax=Bacillus paramycoides TaxID=2026194 RepID=A0A1J9V7F0_9BACI|nr:MULTISPECIES: hypothetical protein [Bacillus cereus group]MED0979783.1 hypothetical protein [Bacillus paramycoides]MED1568669.1 hypothetical protein [Bacillus paramycoides]NWK68905.1 hypothetical protein [Bacillus paramycoides]OJD72157.1 hypothetical protein BAU28_19405 [Bacillus paramycoides]